MVDPGGVRPCQVLDVALAPGAFLPRQLFKVPPPAPSLPDPMHHEPPHRGSVFTSWKDQTSSFSELTQLSMKAATIASNTRRTASTTSLQDNGNYFGSSSMPFYD